MEDKLTELRHFLHQHPEVSDNEKNTSKKIKAFLKSNASPTHMVENIGGEGFIAVYDSGKPGNTLLFRSELDALPIEEINTFNYKSSSEGVSHKCGHDGHMAILAGLAMKLSENPPTQGKVYVLYQPAEETGQGARRMLDDPKMKDIKPDYVFALHNLPGYETGTVLVRDGVFSSASSGLILKFKGKTSHAAEPEKGINPAYAMGKIWSFAETYGKPEGDGDDLKIITPVYCRLGEVAFGTNAGYGEMMFTLRATRSNDFEALSNEFLDSIKELAKIYQLKLEVSWTEVFPNVVNNDLCNRVVEKAAELNHLTIKHPASPFRWSEDFGHFTHNFNGALFGLGSGKDTPALHNPDYDFPDELIGTGSRLFYTILELINKNTPQ